MADNDVLIIIPARMASERLPGKPLADIAGEPMIVHVLRRAAAAAAGPVVVATDSEAIAACVEKAGGRAVMTRADHASGSDRIFEALESIDPEGRAGIVVNVQGDLPTLDPRDIHAALAPLADPAVDIATLAAEIVTTPPSGIAWTALMTRFCTTWPTWPLSALTCQSPRWIWNSPRACAPCKAKPAASAASGKCAT